MEKLTIEQLEQIEKFAEALGFRFMVGYNGDYAVFRISDITADICVRYESEGVCKRPEVTINWSNCDGGKASIVQAAGFMNMFMYAQVLAGKIKDLSDGTISRV